MPANIMNVGWTAPRAAALVTFVVLLTFMGPILSAAEYDVNHHDAPVAGSPLPSNLSLTLAEHYPSVRALVLARGNCVVFEYYRKDIGVETQSPVYSVTKSVLSILVGIARDEGYLRLNEKLSDVFPEEFDENTDPLARNITVRDLLTKTEGFAETGEGDFEVGAGSSGKSKVWRWMLNRRIKYPRGTHFRYDHVGSDLLAVVLSRVIKQRAADFAKKKLFDPLHIDHYTWYSDTEGYLHGEVGLDLTARDMAKIGIVYLQHGRWGDRQIVSADYVRDSTSRHNDGGPPVNAGYGYQWWINETSNGLDAFFASGIKSQLIYVVPQRNIVIAVSADSIPGGSQKFVNNLVIPSAASDSTVCVAQYGQSHSAN